MRKRALASVLGLVAIIGTAAEACGGSDGSPGRPLTLGDVTFADHGTKDVRGQPGVQLEADSYYFSPTFVRGDPGQEVSVKITNGSSVRHNFSVGGGAADKDIDAKSNAAVNVTIPQAGVLLFFCKFHAGQGMNGEFLAGDAKPVAVAKGSPAAGATSSDGSYGY